MNFNFQRSLESVRNGATCLRKIVSFLWLSNRNRLMAPWWTLCIFIHLKTFGILKILKTLTVMAIIWLEICFFFVSNFFLKLYFLSAQVIFTFFDSSSSLKNPSSILRNYITYLYVRITQLYKKFQNNLCVLNFIKQSLFSNAFHIGSIRIGNSQLANDCLPNVTKTLAYCPVYRLLLCPSNKRFDSFCSDSYFEAFLEDLKIEKKFDKIPPVVGWERNPSFSNRIVPFVVLKPNLFK